jgi:hypothetical protein
MLNNQMVSIDIHSPCSTHQLIIFISLSSRAALASPACSRTTPRCFQARPWERGGAWRSLILGWNLMKLGNHHGQIIAEIGKLNDFHTKSSWGIIWANFS